MNAVDNCEDCKRPKSIYVPPGEHGTYIGVLACGHLGKKNCAQEQIADCLSCFVAREAA